MRLCSCLRTNHRQHSLFSRHGCSRSSSPRLGVSRNLRYERHRRCAVRMHGTLAGDAAPGELGARNREPHLFADELLLRSLDADLTAAEVDAACRSMAADVSSGPAYAPCPWIRTA